MNEKILKLENAILEMQSVNIPSNQHHLLATEISKLKDDLLYNLDKYSEDKNFIISKMEDENSQFTSYVLRKSAMNTLALRRGSYPLTKHEKYLKENFSENTNARQNTSSHKSAKFFEYNNEENVDTMKTRLIHNGRCPICTLKPPCKHYDDSHITLEKASPHTMTLNGRNGPNVTPNSFSKTILNENPSKTITPREAKSYDKDVSKKPIAPTQTGKGIGFRANRFAKIERSLNPELMTGEEKGYLYGAEFEVQRAERSFDHRSAGRSFDHRIKETLKTKQLYNLVQTKMKTVDPSVLGEDNKVDEDGKRNEVKKMKEKYDMQLKIQEYKEKKIMAEIVEAEKKKEEEVQQTLEQKKIDEQKKRYRSEQKKIIDELKKKKVEEEQKENELSGARSKKEAQKKTRF